MNLYLNMVTIVALFTVMITFLPYSTAIPVASYMGRIARAQNEDGEDGCPNGLTGPDCTIPYEICPDGIRRCMNNSKCTRSNRVSKHSGTYSYSCDCSYANEISPYAGHECEHSATMMCQDVIRGSHFCTNGGICGDYIYKAQVHTGCHCPADFAGAHCQYLKTELDEDDHMIGRGQVLVSSDEENLWGFVAAETEGKNIEGGIILMFSLVSFIILTLAAAFAVKRKQAIHFMQLEGRDFCSEDNLNLHSNMENGGKQEINVNISQLT